MTPPLRYSSFRVLEEEYLRHLCRRFRHILQSAGHPEQHALRKAGKHGERLEDLEHPDICYALIRHVVDGASRREKSLCDRPINPGTVFDLRYVQGLRNKYDHPKAIELSAAEQLSDLIVAQRLARALEFGSADSDSSDLFQRFEYEIKRQVERLAKSALPDAFDRETSATREEALRDIVVAAVRDTVASLPLTEHGDANRPLRVLDQDLASTLTSGLSDALTRLAEREHQLGGLISSLSELVVAVGTTQERAIAVDANAPTVLETEDGDDELDIGDSAWTWEAAGKGPLSSREGRDLLIGLRERIWEELGTGPSVDGLLRRSMLDQLLRSCPTSDDELHEAIPAYDLQRIDDRQLAFLPEVYAILSRVQQ